MLLKDHYGDWGICLGVWEGYKKGVPGKPGQYSPVLYYYQGQEILQITTINSPGSQIVGFPHWEVRNTPAMGQEVYSQYKNHIYAGSLKL